MSKLRLLSLHSVSLTALVLGALPACGGAPKQEALAVPAVAAAPVVKEEPPDLTPVAAPADLIALGRFRTPKTALETVSAWASFPFKLHDLLPSEMHDLETVIAWDAPLELAVALDPDGEGKVPEPLTVASIGLNSLDGALSVARAHGQPVKALRSGVYRVGDADGISCVAALALGTTPARLVCGHRSRDVDGLLGYATRGLPNEVLPSRDFQVELRLAPVKKKYAAEIGSARMMGGFLLRQAQLDNPRFDRALADTAYGLIDESLAFLGDLDKLRLEATIDPTKNQVDARLDMKFAGQKSWLVQAQLETLPLATPAPDLFWQLPADSTSAGYSVGWKPGRLKPLGHALGELLDAYLDAQKAPAKLREQASKSIELAFDQNTKQVRAQGDLPDVPKDALLAADYRMFGWQLAGIDGEPKQLLASLDAFSATLNNRDLSKVLKERISGFFDPHAKSLEEYLPKVSSHAVTVKGFKAGAKAYRVDMPRALFEKLAKNELTTEGGKPGKEAKSVPVAMVVAYDGQRTWLGVSPDEKALIGRLEALKDPKAAVLSSRAGLDELKAKPRIAGGFLTLTRFAGQLTALGTRPDDVQRLLAALPHHGETPMIMSYDLSAQGPDLSVNLTVPRAAIEDLGALVPAVALTVGKNSILAAP